MPEGVVTTPLSKLPKEERAKNLAWVATIISQAQATGFYGEITLKFEQGVARRVVKSESLIPPP